MKVFAVRDSALGEYMNPFVAPTTELAARSFKDNVNASDCPMNAHPEDYELFDLGVYDVVSGKIISHPAPISVERAKDVIKSAPAQSELRLAK